MNSRNIAKSLRYKLDDWCKSIECKSVVDIIKKEAMVTGGALVSLLNGEQPNDYDIYFKTKEGCKAIADYYAQKWNQSKPTKITVQENPDDTSKIECFIQRLGGKLDIRGEDFESVGGKDTFEDNCIDDPTEPINPVPDGDGSLPYASENSEEPTKPNPVIQKPAYRPRYFSTNAISLSDGIQIIIRFYGDVEEIHNNFDFVHCTCSYDYKTNSVNLPNDALEAIINKELIYVGSKYPLCSIIRTRKFISRGYTINAGQYVKMALQLNDLDLKNIKVFKDQLVGVDSLYFNEAIAHVEKKMQEEGSSFTLTNPYLFEIINRIFG